MGGERGVGVGEEIGVGTGGGVEVEGVGEILGGIS